tara:strand:- start:369 stop:560 length:192 start_codon:yes stop_codon:yes gene_type:complete
MKDIDEDEILWQKLDEFTKPKNKKEIVVIRQWNWLAKRSRKILAAQVIKITIEDGIKKNKFKK